jgi:calcineurin-like phosphoesterase family protein
MTKKDLEIYNSIKDAPEEIQRNFIISKESSKRHDEAIIKNHNERINDEDIILYLGDFCFKNSSGGKEGEGGQIRALDLMKSLKGRIVFISGNHDRGNSLKTPIISCKIRYGDKIMNCVHNPEYADMNCDINFCGHVHQLYKYKLIKKDNNITICANVGIDVWNFRPVTIEEVLNGLYKWKKENNYK